MAELPLSHLPRAVPPVPVDLPEGVGLPAALHRIREAARTALTQDQPWQAVLDGVRPQVQRLWGGWDVSVRARFLRHARSLWNLHRHRVAPQIGDFLAEQRRSGGLEVMAGRLLPWSDAMGGAEVVIRRHGGGQLRRQVARIIQCVGPDGASTWRQTAPVPQLLGEPLGLGLQARADGQAMGAAGNIVPGFAGVGPLTRGLLWEITAVPESVPRPRRPSAASCALDHSHGGMVKIHV
jgi:uncharacterized NAD(P)/FAD-binding protein YdhS